MSENKHIEINFKDNNKCNEQEQSTRDASVYGAIDKELVRCELENQEKQNPPIRHKDDVEYNPDLNAKDDKLSPEIVYETWEKQKCKNEPITDRIKDVVNFDEAKKMMNSMDAIYANADVETDPLYDPNNTNPNFNFNSDIRDYNIGTSDYSQHKIQPWDIWEDYNLNPWDADIVKRVLRKKELPGLEDTQSRIEDYKKIIHICLKRIDQINKGTVIL